MALATCNALGEESRCFGTPSNGRLEDGVKLPASGANFTAYSTLGTMLGRTYVHSAVASVVLVAYKALEASAPDVTFVYGETGWPEGGRFRPHRTHQNGLAIDFMVPVRDGGRSVPLPTGPTNKFGYNIEFDAEGRFGDLGIDFAAIAEHLYQLELAAQSKGIAIARVIFDPPYLKKLFDTPRGSYLRNNVAFMQTPAWIRHDEHYHVDFDIGCEPLEG